MTMINVAICGDIRALEKEIGEIVKYGPVKDEISLLWYMQKVFIIPVVVGVLGVVYTRYQKYWNYVEG